MSYKTTLENLARDTQVHVDLQYSSSSSTDASKKTSTPTTSTWNSGSNGNGVDEVDSFKNRWVTGTILEVKSDSVIVQLDDHSIYQDDEEDDSAVYHQTSFSVEPEEDTSIRECKVEQVYLRNPESIQAADDITTISYLHEPALLTNLYIRYKKKLIYTFCGNILIAINPYQRLSKDMYSREAIEIYRGVPMGKLSPHVYAMAEDCFSSMMREGKNQSILVSGESGAGKTETTKFLLQYFAAMGHKGSSSTTDTKKNSIENQVLLSTPLLEAFGNAKTLRNDNSSRFGKFIEVQFNSIGVISGAFLYTYLLEKSRVTKQTLGERNYHIFYQLVDSCTDEERTELLQNKRMQEFYYLNQSDCYYVDSVSDAETYELTKQAMTSVGITESEQQSIRRVLAAILHFGNVTFEEVDHDSCRIVDYEPLKKACELLQLDSEAISKTFITRKVVAARDSYTTPLKVDQAESCRDALAMLLYSRMFDWIVKRMNESINNPSQAKYTIGVLDIYGFESFENNSFEQFCINYANEKLQQQYNQHIFKLSQQEYLREKINWSMLQFNDNQVCLDLIENSPLCILKILDEECSFPKSNEKTFAEKLYKNHTNHPSFSKPRFSNTAFTINHYADAVTYDTTHFLTKNKDYIVPEQLEMLKTCGNVFLKALFSEPPKPTSASAAKSSFKFTSVASQFKDSLAMLMDKISKTYPHYIRCIKPNSQKKPGLFNFELILSQLKCGGILESIRICLEGYPTKKTYNEFFERYKIVSPDVMGTDVREACQKLLEIMGIDNEQYQFGISKIFLRSGQIEKMEMHRSTKLSHSAILIQKNVRRMIQRKLWKATRSSSTEIETVIRTSLAIDDYERRREDDASRKIGQVINKSLARRDLLEVEEVVVSLQNTIVRQLNSNSLREKKLTLRLALSVQSIYRTLLKTESYKAALAEAKSIEGLKKQKEELESKYKELVNQMEDDSSSKTRLEEEKQALEKEKEEITNQMKEAQQAWEEKYINLESQYSQVQTELEKVRNEYSSLQQLLDENKKDLEEEIQHSEELESKVSSLEQEIKSKSELFESDKASLASEIASLKEVTESRDKDIEELKSSISKLTSDYEQLTQQLQVTENDKQTVETEVANLKDELANKTKELADIRKELRDADEECNALQREIDQKDAKIRELDQLVKDLTKRCEDLSGQLDDLRRSIAENSSANDIQVHDLTMQLEAKSTEIKELKYALEEETEKLEQEQERRSREENDFAIQFEQMMQQHQEELDEQAAVQKELKGKIKSKDSEIESLKQQLEEEMNRLSGEIQVRTKIEQDNSQLETEKATLIEEMKKKDIEFQSTTASLEQNIDNLKSEIASLQANLESETNDRKRVEQEKADLMVAMNSSELVLTEKYAQLQSEHSSLQSTLEAVSSDKQQVQQQLEQQIQMFNAEVQLRTQVEEQNVNLEEEKSGLIKELQRTQEEYHQQLVEKDKASTQLQQRLEAIQAELSEERTVKANLQSENRTLEMELESVQTTLTNERSKFEYEADKASQQYKALVQLLEVEKERVANLSRQMKSIEVEKTRVMKRKEAEMAWEIDKNISVFPGNRQERAERFIVYLMFEVERDFCGGVVPTPSFLFYHMIMTWRSDMDGCERLLQLIENLLKATLTNADSKALPFWFSTIASLLQLCTSADFLANVEHLQELATDDPEFSVDGIREKITEMLHNESYMTFNEELDMIIAKHDSKTPLSNNIFIKFIQQMTHLFMNSYAQLVHNCCDSMSQLLKANIIDQTLFDTNAGRSPNSEALNCVVEAVKDFMQTLRVCNIADKIVSKAMNQIFTYMDITLFNEILFRKDICSSAKGAQLKARITQLENDIVSSTGMKPSMNLVSQAIAVLTTDKRSLLKEPVRRKLMPNLNSSQILKILRMYNCSEFESNIPHEVYVAFSVPSPALVPLFPETSTILDAKEVIPFDSISEIENSELKAELPFMSFPIPIKEQLTKMREEQYKREQEQFVLAASALKESVQKVASNTSSATYVLGDTSPRVMQTPRGESANQTTNTTTTNTNNNNRKSFFWRRS